MGRFRLDRECTKHVVYNNVVTLMSNICFEYYFHVSYVRKCYTRKNTWALVHSGTININMPLLIIRYIISGCNDADALSCRYTCKRKLHYLQATIQLTAHLKFSSHTQDPIDERLKKRSF
jgi:hypothetical protein